ncbi:MAG: carbamoyltransferase HypF [Promethearchaeota archaeon]
MKRAKIHVTGVVQGIGFRPFIYRLAQRLNMKGYVLNRGDAGVEIVVEGEKEVILDFCNAIKEEKPVLSRIESFKIKWSSFNGNFDSFTIKESSKEKGSPKGAVFPPDIAICDDCRKEIFDKNYRRYNYPLISCTNCGPRFTVIEGLPYDRERTSMKEFPLCESCAKEFIDPTTRWLNAQTMACPICGPRVRLYEKDGTLIESKNPIEVAARLISEGSILAIKGRGGIHLAVKTSEDGPVIKLRQRRKKSNKPFAVMSPDLIAIEKFAIPTSLEKELLLSFQRPIVVIRKRTPFIIPEEIALGLDTIGVMLPYSGIHYLLFKHLDELALVMTSANQPSEPMFIQNEKAIRNLGNIVDYFLLHNRQIFQRNDDSVVKIVAQKETFLRRSRGYVPEYITVPFKNINAIGVGPETNVTLTLIKSDKAFMSQHIGDIDNLTTLNALKEALDHYMNLLNPEKIDVVCCDLHPSFLTTRYAKELSSRFDCEVIPVQHHDAHLKALMADLKTYEPMILIAIDGFGYGAFDELAWGGEILEGDLRSFTRPGSLIPQPMPGGDFCTYYPCRMLGSILYREIGEDRVRNLLRKYCIQGFKHGDQEIDVMLRQLEHSINVSLTTSAGRFLDAVSALLNLCQFRTYEGEPAIRLEAVARNGKPIKLPVEDYILYEKGRILLDTSRILLDLVELKEKGVPAKNIASTAQYAVAKGLSEIALEIAKERGINIIGVSGGVAYNDFIVRTIGEHIKQDNLKFAQHTRIPPGDGGVSIGQAIAGAAKFQKHALS